jgi:hypothetical protein
MTNKQLQTFLDRHGADPTRWPQDERAGVESLIARSAQARAMFAAAQRFDTALARHAAARLAADASVERVLERLGAPLPRQQVSIWRLPAVLLDWQFAPAWPRMAALGACALFGFFIGIAGLDRHIDRTEGIAVASNTTDLGSVVFEPEPLTGARP